jgi:predicted permease
VTLYESNPTGRETTSLVAPGRLEDWQRLSRTFVAISGSYTENVTDTSATEPERLEGRRVTPRYFAVFGASTIAGRVFTAEEEQAEGPGAAVISDGFWARRFQRRPDALGHALLIGGRRFEIVGVMPATFATPSIDVWLPAKVAPRMLAFREARFVRGVGRLRSDVTIEEGARDLVSVQDALGRQFPRTDAGWSVEVRPLKDAQIGDARRGLVLVFGAVAALWIIAVANIAGLTLVQVRRRTRELALRAALGASRGRVIADLVREGLIVAILGGALGSLLAASLISIMPTVLVGTPRLNELGLDWRPLAFAAMSSLLAAAAFSLVPALAGTRSQLMPSLAAGSRTVAGTRHLLQRSLVVGQVALSVLLVGSATLLLRSYYNLTRVDTGFDPTSVFTFHVGARWDEDRPRVGRLQEQLLARLEQLPHVQAAGITNFLPATGATLRYQVKVDGLNGPNQDGSMTVGMRMIGGGYLRAIRAPLLKGSWCPALTMDFARPHEAMVNKRFLEMYAPTENLVGRSIRVLIGPGVPLTIVGVVGDLAEDGQATTVSPYVYTCDSAGAWPDPEYVVRTADASAFASDLRRVVGELDPARAIFGLRPLRAVLDAALDRPRLNATMLGGFASAAVTLAAIGLYSLFMLVVSERSREMAVMLAIGAEPRQMIRLVLSGAARLLGGGLVLGMALTAGADRFFRGVLFGVSAIDVGALAIATVTLGLVSLLAVAGPALRAARIAPIDALKGE